MTGYAFEAALRDGYLHVRVGGDNSPATIRRYLGDVVVAATRERCPYALIEERLDGPRLSMGEIFSIVQEKSEDFRPALRLVAYVDVNARGSSNMKFAEDVAINRGVTVGVFGTVEDASRWLRKKIESAPPERSGGPGA